MDRSQGGGMEISTPLPAHDAAPAGDSAGRLVHVSVAACATGVAALASVAWGSPAIALIAGAAVAHFGLNRWPERTRRWQKQLLAGAVVALGAGLDVRILSEVGGFALALAMSTIAGTLLLGILLARLLRIDAKLGLLIAAGTAICGGSAIGAVAPTVRAREHQITAAMGTVFLLNAVALVVFPAVGAALGMDAERFGLWCAVAIHDTSSVVGAAMRHSPEALALATSVKLARALFIVPVTAGLAARTRKREGGDARAARPWFIAGFLLVALAFNATPALAPLGDIVSGAAEHGLVLALFFVGTTLEWRTIRGLGARPLLQGTTLWIAVSLASLGAVLLGLG